jgi:hypothetical protein
LRPILHVYYFQRHHKRMPPYLTWPKGIWHLLYQGFLLSLNPECNTPEQTYRRFLAGRNLKRHIRTPLKGLIWWYS